MLEAVCFRPFIQGAPMRVFKNNLLKSFALISLFSAMTVSCAVQTEPTTLGERSARAAVDKAALFGGQEEIIKPVTLYEAMARAIKYNSDQRVALMEQAVAYGIADSASMELLPEVAATGGFSSRSKKLTVSADSFKTGQQTLEDSYIEDRTVRSGQLQMVYNVLDFGISYVNAKQASDRRYISEELRRKSIHQVIHEVRVAFWKAAAAQRIVDDLAVLIGSVQDELVRVNTGSAEKTREQLEEQKKLLMALQNLTELRNEVLTAKVELGALMNLPPNTEFTLDIPAEMDQVKIVKDFGQIDLEHFALVNRPELRIGDYEARIAEAEAKKEILRLFPGIEFEAGINYNSNSYLKNKNWAEAGIGVTWNLMKLFVQPKAIRLAKDREELERLRRLAMTMAVTTQVNVSFLQMRQAADAFEVADSLNQVDEGLWQKVCDSFGVWRVVTALIVVVVFLFLCADLCHRGMISQTYAVVMFIIDLSVICGSIYLVYYNEYKYWGAFRYISQHSYDLSKNRNSFVLRTKIFFIKKVISFASIEVVYSLFILTDMVLRLLNCSKNLFFAFSPFYIALLIIALGYTQKRDLHFDKELNRFWRGKEASSVYDLEDGKYQDVTELQKIKDFSIDQNDGYYDLEMCLDNSSKIKLISNADMEYLKKIEGELREFLELK